MCFVLVLEQTATFVLCNTNWLVFTTDMKFLLCGWNWVFKEYSLSFVFKSQYGIWTQTHVTAKSIAWSLQNEETELLGRRYCEKLGLTPDLKANIGTSLTYVARLIVKPNPNHNPHHRLISFSPVSLLHAFNSLTEAFPCSSLTSHKFGLQKTSCLCKKCPYTGILKPGTWHCSIKCSQLHKFVSSWVSELVS
jgi:hypothetical protein